MDCEIRESHRSAWGGTDNSASNREQAQEEPIAAEAVVAAHVQGIHKEVQRYLKSQPAFGRATTPPRWIELMPPHS